MVTVSGPGEDRGDRGELGRAHVLVVDAAGLAFPGALVTVNGGTQRTADDEGIVVFDLPAGRYEVIPELAGFGSVRKLDVAVEGSRTTSLVFELVPLCPVVMVGERARVEEGSAYRIAELTRGIAIPTGVRHEPGAGPAVFVDGSTGIAYLPDRAVSDALLGVPGYLPGSGSLAGWSMTQATYTIDGVRVDRSGRLGP